MMRLHVKLMGVLKDRTPENGELRLNDETTIQDVLRILGIESETIQACSINGSIERNRDRTLQDGDELIVLPPVGGG